MPLYSQEQAMELAYHPIARMIDDSICERIEGTSRYDANWVERVTPAATSALFRVGARKPFKRTVSREDGVFVTRFLASPGEVIVSRAYSIDPATMRERFGPPILGTCLPMGTVEVGEPGAVD